VVRWVDQVEEEGVEMAEIPRPDVNVKTDAVTGKTHVVISRDGRGRSYEVTGVGVDDKIRDAVGKVLGDAYSAEWLP
jgi:hypothetical protein